MEWKIPFDICSRTKLESMEQIMVKGKKVIIDWREVEDEGRATKLINVRALIFKGKKNGLI